MEERENVEEEGSEVSRVELLLLLGVVAAAAAARSLTLHCTRLLFFDFVCLFPRSQLLKCNSLLLDFFSFWLLFVFYFGILLILTCVCFIFWIIRHRFIR